MKAAANVVVALLVVAAAACDAPLSNDALLMCNAARFLRASIDRTADALATDAAGRPEEAAEQAVEARGFAEGAARTLNEVEQATQAKADWQSLIRAYKHAADAASSLLPGFQALPGAGDESLEAARGALDGARIGLPLSCFEVPPG